MKISISILCVLLFIACTNQQTEIIEIPKESKRGDILNLEEFEDEESGNSITTGHIIMPENWSDEHSNLIELPFKIIRSKSQTPAEPVFWLSGGPGMSNLTYQPPAELLAERDVVMIGYRGGDGMTRLNCDEFLDLEGKQGLFNEGAIAQMKDNVSACLAEWKNQGLDINCYTMIDVVDDMEYARKVLGYARINLLSGSYGTRLAQIFAYRYPESLHRSVMVSVNPPGHFVWPPEMIDQQIEYYSELWAKDPVYSQKTDDLASLVKRTIRNLPEKWLFFNIDPDNVRFATFNGLYHTSGAGSVFDVYIAADNGDPSGMAVVSLMADLQLKMMDVAWGDMLAKPFGDYDPSINYAEEMNLNDYIIGSPGSQLFAVYPIWPIQTKDTLYRESQICQTEILLLSGNIDFSTPAEFARDELLPYLPNGKQYIFSNYGHTGDIMYRDPEAFSLAITSFFNTGVADVAGFEKRTVDFKPALRFPLLAKVLISLPFALILLIVGVVFLVKLLIRRLTAKREVKT